MKNKNIQTEKKRILKLIEGFEQTLVNDYSSITRKTSLEDLKTMLGRTSMYIHGIQSNSNILMKYFTDKELTKSLNTIATLEFMKYNLLQIIERASAKECLLGGE